LSAIVLGYLFLKKQEQYKETDALKAIPVNSEIIVQFQDAALLQSKLNEEQGMWKAMSQFEAVKNINQTLEQLHQLLSSSPEGRNLNLNRKLTIASHIVGKNGIDFLFLFPLQDYLEEKQIKLFMESLSREEIHSKTYNNTSLYSLSLEGGKKSKLHYAFSQGLFLISKSSLLLEESIRQLGASTNVTQSNGFARIQKTIGKKVDANIYVNLKTFPKLLSTKLDPQYRYFVKDFKDFANWTELDLTLRDNILFLNGFSYSDTQQANYLNLFLDQKPVRMEMESILPSSTSMVAILGIQDPLQFKKQYRNYLEKKGELLNYEKNLNLLNQKTNSNPENIIYSILHKELALVFTGKNKDNQFGVIRTKSPSVAKDKMLQIIKGFADKNKHPLSFYIHNYSLDRETQFQIYKLPGNHLLHQIFGSLFSDLESAYFTFIGNYMVLGSSVSKLSEFIHESILGKTLSNSPKYEQYSEYLSAKSNFHFYTSMVKSTPIISTFLNQDLKKRLKNSRETINKFQSIGYQFSSSQGLVYNNLFVNYDPIVDIPPQTDWESKLDTFFRHKPYLVKNHYTKEKEILVQDVKNKLYLINPSGRILWYKKLDEPIVGQIQQIDYYRNNKLQYLFTTRNSIHLVDRNGNNVANFPVRLRANTTLGLSLFDYEGRGKFRIFVPCDNKAIYCFDKTGKILPGWKFGKAENEITGTMQHFRVGAKDYLVFADKYRIYILNRKGQERVKLKQQFSKSKFNPFVLEKATQSHPARLVCTDQAGTIHYCYFDGRVEEKALAKFSDKHYFLINDINADGQKEYLFSDNQSFKIYNEKGSPLLQKEFNSPISYRPGIYTFSHNRKEIGLCLAQENQIYLINNRGDNHKGFPLAGNSPFTIGFTRGKQKGFNLFVGSSRNFLLNYSVQ
jgi:hypothetical protein